ncbi:MAG TPA: DMT family transporter [Candidatus Paceibacterota bacterium]|nr:DMT family transporter [Candidatus Paceibacterota bacterium]
MSYGPLLIFIAAVLWGLDGILRRALFGLPPITIVFFEHLIGLLIIAPFLIRAWRRERLERREWAAISVVALLSGVLGTLFFTAALLQVNFIPFSVVFLIQKLQPIFALAVADFILKERVTQSYLGFAGLALLAGYFVTFPMGAVNFSDGGAHITAALLALCAAIAWGSSTALSRYALLNHSNTFITGLRFLLTVPIALVFVFALGAIDSLREVTPVQFGYLALIAISTGMLSLWIYYRGLRTTPVRTSAIVELAFPMTAVFVDYFLYGVALHWSQYLAAIVLLYAMYKVSSLRSDSMQS